MTNEQSPKKPYEVLGIDELSKLGDTGGVVRYYRFRIKTQGGTVLTVDIDLPDYENEAKVREILSAKAAHADKLKSL